MTAEPRSGFSAGQKHNILRDSIMSSDRWQKLYRKADAEAPDSVVASSAHTMSEAWCAGVAKDVMEQLNTQAVRRADQFKAETGHAIGITFPARAPDAQVASAAPEMLFLKLALDGTLLYVYSARANGKLPALHALSAVDQLRPALARRRSAHPPAADRIVSRPLGRVVKTAAGGYELQERVSNGSGSAIDMDTIVFKAFETLVTLWRRSKKA
jgi:hypothetical protein